MLVALLIPVVPFLRNITGCFFNDIPENIKTRIKIVTELDVSSLFSVIFFMITIKYCIIIPNVINYIIFRKSFITNIVSYFTCINICETNSFKNIPISKVIITLKTLHF